LAGVLVLVELIGNHRLAEVSSTLNWNHFAAAR
jgi:hypothetical protein